MCCFGSKDTSESEIDLTDARSIRSFPSYTSSEYEEMEHGPPLRTHPPPRLDDFGTGTLFSPLQRLRLQTFPITPPRTPPRIPTPFGTPTPSRTPSPLAPPPFSTTPPIRFRQL